MIRRPPIATRTDTLFPYTTLVRSASSPAEKSVSPFSRPIEANGAGCQGVWTPRATQQAAPLRSPKAFHLGFLMQLGSTRTRLWNEAEQRSEEHTSELQSLMRISYAVFCLKKKKKKNKDVKQTTQQTLALPTNKN